MVRTWVAPDLALGLRIQVWGRPGGLAKTIGFYRILKFGDRWVAGIVTVEPTDRMSRTVLEGVKGERDVTGLEVGIHAGSGAKIFVVTNAVIA